MRAPEHWSGGSCHGNGAEHWSGGSCHGNGEATQRLTSRKLRFSLLFLLFSVSLVPKISQILNTTIPDTSLACI